MTETGRLNLDWLDVVHSPVFVLDSDQIVVLRLNDSLRRILRPDIPTAPTPLADLIGAGAANCIIEFIRTMPADHSRNTLSVTCPTAHGSMMLIMHLRKLPDETTLWSITVDERTLFFQSVASENTEETFRGIIQALPIGIDIFDATWRGVFYNAYSDSLYLYDPYYDLEHREWFERAFPDPTERQRAFTVWNDAHHALEIDPSQPQSMEWRVFCRDGRYRVLSNRMSKIGSYYAFIYWDITEQRRLEDQLRELANTDVLTGTYNRRFFFEAAEAVLASADRETTDLCAMLLDIDHFKSINDSRGHRAGDEALTAIAGLCRSVLRPTDILARLGGEEFAVLLPDTKIEEAVRLATRLRESIAGQTIATREGALAVTVSLGVAALEGTTQTVDQLIEQADAALYRAKHAGRNRVAASTDPPTEATSRAAAVRGSP